MPIKRLSKWYNAPLGLGQAWVNVTTARVVGTMYNNITNRTIAFYIGSGSGTVGCTFNINGVIFGAYIDGQWCNFTLPVGASYSASNPNGLWLELR